MKNHLRILSTRARAVAACYDAFETAPGLRPARPEDEQLRVEVSRLRDALRDLDLDEEMQRGYGAPAERPPEPADDPRRERIGELQQTLATLMVGLVADTRPGRMPELHDANFAVEDAKPLVAELHELLAELEAEGEPVSRGRWRMPRKPD